MVCAECGIVFHPPSPRSKYHDKNCRLRAKWRNENHNRRSIVKRTDLTAADIGKLRQAANRCPRCKTRLVDEPYLPASKELDHRLPLGIGGSHTHANTRIICRACNLARPKDASDENIQLGIWDHHEYEVPPPRPPKPQTIPRHLESEWMKMRRANRKAMLPPSKYQISHRIPDPPGWFLTKSTCWPPAHLLNDLVRTLHASGLGQKAIARRTDINVGRIKATYDRLGLQPHLSLHLRK